MSQHELPPIEIIKTTYAYEACTHFLNPKGSHNHRFAWVKEPTVEAAVMETASPDRHSEIAWINFNVHPRVEITTNSEADTLYGRRQPLRELYLATMWQDGEYSFQTLDELVAAPELPTYTAAWLARFINGTGRKGRGEAGLSSELTELSQKEPLVRLLAPSEIEELFPKLQGENTVKLNHAALTERCQRLGQLAISEHPHLEQWYMTRELLEQS